MKLRRLFLSGLVFACAAFFSATISGNTVKAYTPGSIIPNGVKIGGFDVSGMTADEAKTALTEMLSVYDDTEFTLVANDEEVTISGKDLCIEPFDTDMIGTALHYGNRGNIIERYVAKKDIASGKGKSFDLSLTCDKEIVKNILEEKSKDLNREPEEHTLIRKGGKFEVKEGHSGVVLDIEQSVDLIADYITTQWDGGEASIDLAVEVKEPKGSKDDLLQIKDLMGSYHTDYSPTTGGRATNIKVGTARINGNVVYPGEEFSVTEYLGEQNAANGYMPAGSYENGTVVQTYGGGVCQISTTLYNAVIRAELEIVQRYPHSMVVGYVKPSMDAAIAEGFKDLVFKNSYDYPIYIEGYTEGPNLYFNIYGKEVREAGRKVDFESEILSTITPQDKFVANPNLPAGTISRASGAHTGYSARLWKVVTVNGKEKSREIFNTSSYRASGAVYNVGTASADPAASAAIANAISSQNREAIEAAAAGVPAPAPEGAPAPETPVAPVVPETPVTPVEPEVPYAPEEGF